MITEVETFQDPVLGTVIKGRIEKDPDAPDRIPLGQPSTDYFCPGCDTRNGCVCAWLEDTER